MGKGTESGAPEDDGFTARAEGGMVGERAGKGYDSSQPVWWGEKGRSDGGDDPWGGGGTSRGDFENVRTETKVQLVVDGLSSLPRNVVSKYRGRTRGRGKEVEKEVPTEDWRTTSVSRGGGGETNTKRGEKIGS